MTDQLPSNSNDHSDFEKAAQQEGPGLFGEFWNFLRYNKKWWLTPIIVVLILVALALVVAGPAAPFIYTLF